MVNNLKAARLCSAWRRKISVRGACLGGLPGIDQAPRRPAVQEASSGSKVESDDERAARFRIKLRVFLKFRSAVNPQFRNCKQVRVHRPIKLVHWSS